MKTWKMYVDGKWIDAQDGRTHAVENPATEEDVALVPDASLADLDRAIAAARRAFDEGPWPRTPLSERIAILERIADVIERRKEEFRSVLVSAFGAEAVTHPQQLDSPIAPAPQLRRARAPLPVSRSCCRSPSSRRPRARSS